MQKQITVQFLNQPKAGKKKGSIKTTDGEYIGCWPNELDNFQEGGSYTVEIEFNDFNGKQYMNLAKGSALQGGQAAPQKAAGSPPMGDAVKQKTITRLAIAKSCIQAGADESKANFWYNWVLERKAQEPAAGAPGASDDLDDEIPF
jgi:hypothetical protein